MADTNTLKMRAELAAQKLGKLGSSGPLGARRGSESNYVAVWNQYVRAHNKLAQGPYIMTLKKKYQG